MPSTIILEVECHQIAGDAIKPNLYTLCNIKPAVRFTDEFQDYQR